MSISQDWIPKFPAPAPGSHKRSALHGARMGTTGILEFILTLTLKDCIFDSSIIYHPYIYIYMYTQYIYIYKHIWYLYRWFYCMYKIVQISSFGMIIPVGDGTEIYLKQPPNKQVILHMECTGFKFQLNQSSVAEVVSLSDPWNRFDKFWATQILGWIILSHADAFKMNLGTFGCNMVQHGATISNFWDQRINDIDPIPNPARVPWGKQLRFNTRTICKQEMAGFNHHDIWKLA